MQLRRLNCSVLITLLILLVGVALFYYIVVPYPTITFVITEDFKGPILVSEAPDALAFPRFALWYNVEIPESGFLGVRSFAFLGQRAIWKARTVSGLDIPTNSEATDGQVALRGNSWLSVNGHAGQLFFFVGTRAEFDDYDVEGLLMQRGGAR